MFSKILRIYIVITAIAANLLLYFYLFPVAATLPIAYLLLIRKYAISEIRIAIEDLQHLIHSRKIKEFTITLISFIIDCVFLTIFPLSKFVLYFIYDL